MQIYQQSGYIDIRKILSLGMPFIFMFGGRGTGKTYTSLEICIEDALKFIYMRRTQTQVDIVVNPEYSPFKILNKDFNWNIGSKIISKNNSAWYKQVYEDDKIIPVGSPVGYTCALSTISNIRGFDASDVPILLYDEFIPEKHERPIKNEAHAFLNAVETINRNRELKGEPPLIVMCMANSNDVANPIFMELHLVRKAMEMKRKKQEVFINKERGMVLINMEFSPISEQKKTTALYRLTGGNSNFARMSLNNEFAGDEVGRIASRPLTEYKPVVSIGEITIYSHKSNRSIYVSTHKTGSPPYFRTGDTERARFRRIYSWLWDEYMENNIEFEEYLCEILLTKFFN